MLLKIPGKYSAAQLASPLHEMLHDAASSPITVAEHTERSPFNAPLPLDLLEMAHTAN